METIYSSILILTSLFFSTADSENRIFGGRKVTIEEFPFYTRIVIEKNGEKILCGGSIIYPKWVITARHCTEGSKLVTVYAGVDSDDSLDNPNIAESIIEHPVYDLALVRLTYALEFDEKVQGVRHARPHEDKSLSNVRVVGFGRTESGEFSPFLKAVSVESSEINSQHCLDLLKNFLVSAGKRGWTSEELSRLEESQFEGAFFCVAKKNGEGPCSGDSGGPLVSQRADGAQLLIGIPSMESSVGNITCSDSKKAFAIYIRVSKFFEWIYNST